MDLFESFATATFNYNPDAELPLHSVTFYNLKTQAPIKIDVLPDTGASITVLQEKYARLLGVDLSSIAVEKIEGVGGKTEGGYKQATVPMRIANLAPVPVDILFGPIHLNILGRQRGFSHYLTRFTWNKIYYQELAKQAAATKKAAAFAQSYATFKGRR